jgi:hypothetical protein
MSRTNLHLSPSSSHHTLSRSPSRPTSPRPRAILPKKPVRKKTKCIILLQTCPTTLLIVLQNFWNLYPKMKDGTIGIHDYVKVKKIIKNILFNLHFIISFLFYYLYIFFFINLFILLYFFCFI